MPFIGNSPYQVAFLTDTFSGNNSTTTFTMSVAPANTTSVLVIVSGVVQDPSTYSVSGTTLTFSAAPPTGTGNISTRYLGIPASGVATTAYRTKTEFTATAGQTTFTPPSYTVGFINVYRNGVMLGSADFTATNGTTVVLATGATAGDLVTTESFFVSSVVNALPSSGGTITGNLVVTGNETVNGSLGLGISPSYILDIYQPASATANSRARIQGNTNQVDWFAVNNGNGVYVGVDNSTGSITGTAYGGYLYASAAKPIGFFTNAIQRMTLDSNGYLNIANQPMISARHTTTEAPNGGSPFTQWSLTLNVGGGAWTSGTGTYTIPKTGNYMLTCSLLHLGGTAAGGVFVKVNGTNVHRIFYVGVTTDYSMGSGQIILPLNSGDAVQFTQENTGVSWYGDGGGLGSFSINMLS